MKKLLVLLYEAVSRFRKYPYKRIFVQSGESGGNGDSPDELGNPAVGLQIRRLNKVEGVVLGQRRLASEPVRTDM